jgi:hydroxymethylglutaryl-CoA lyase
MGLPERVTIVEVGPRDGLQNERLPVATAVKAALIRLLVAAGLRIVEATSFVSPKWVPQLADASDLMARLERPPGVRFPVLVPNRVGLERAQAAGAGEIAIFTAASETFSQRNLNGSIAATLERYREVCDAAMRLGLPVRGYISCVLGCPYEGEVATRAVVELALALRELGCSEIALGDTIGVGTPHATGRLIERVATEIGADGLAVHFHDTYGMAIANVWVALERGVTVVDAAVAGLGGCPFAPGASGNVATEDVVYLLEGAGIECGVDLSALAQAGQYICEQLGRSSASRVARALAAARCNKPMPPRC